MGGKDFAVEEQNRDSDLSKANETDPADSCSG
jgi:hypothetical protein